MSQISEWLLYNDIAVFAGIRLLVRPLIFSWWWNMLLEENCLITLWSMARWWVFYCWIICVLFNCSLCSWRFDSTHALVTKTCRSVDDNELWMQCIFSLERKTRDDFFNRLFLVSITVIVTWSFTDLKPENLLLDKHYNVKIADFGAYDNGLCLTEIIRK